MVFLGFVLGGECRRSVSLILSAILFANAGEIFFTIGRQILRNCDAIEGNVSRFVNKIHVSTLQAVGAMLRRLKQIDHALVGASNLFSIT